MDTPRPSPRTNRTRRVPHPGRGRYNDGFLVTWVNDVLHAPRGQPALRETSLARDLRDGSVYLALVATVFMHRKKLVARADAARLEAGGDAKALQASVLLSEATGMKVETFGDLREASVWVCRAILLELLQVACCLLAPSPCASAFRRYRGDFLWLVSVSMRSLSLALSLSRSLSLSLSLSLSHTHTHFLFQPLYILCRRTARTSPRGASSRTPRTLRSRARFPCPPSKSCISRSPHYHQIIRSLDH